MNGWCAGYDLQSRWPKLFGEEVLDEWQRDGSRAFQVGRGRGDAAVAAATDTGSCRFQRVIGRRSACAVAGGGCGLHAWIAQVRGEEVRIPFDFIEDGRKHPAFPQYRCPALVVQGVRDEVVPSSTVMQALQHSRTVRNPVQQGREGRGGLGSKGKAREGLGVSGRHAKREVQGGG